MSISPHRIGTACLLVLTFGLAGCADQPIATLEQPRTTSLAAQAHLDVYFQPASANLAYGEQEKLRRFLADLMLRPTDGIEVDVPSSGIARTDARRGATLRAAIGPVPADVTFRGTPGFVETNARPDAAFIQVLRPDRVEIDCVNSGRSALATEILVPFPPMGCVNTINRAEMAAKIRDLTNPAPMGSTDAVTSVAAIKRYQEGTTKPAPFDVGD